MGGSRTKKKNSGFYVLSKLEKKSKNDNEEEKKYINSQIEM